MYFRKKSPIFYNCNFSHTISMDQKNDYANTGDLQANGWNRFCEFTEIDAFQLQREYMNLINTPIYSSFYWECERQNQDNLPLNQISKGISRNWIFQNFIV